MEALTGPRSRFYPVLMVLSAVDPCPSVSLVLVTFPDISLLPVTLATF
jgi:hypothetical protein